MVNTETIINMLHLIKNKPGIFFSEENSFYNLKIFLMAYMLGAGDTTNINLKKISTWYAKRNKIELSVFIGDYIEYTYKDLNDLERQQILINAYVVFFKKTAVFLMLIIK